MPVCGSLSHFPQGNRRLIRRWPRDCFPFLDYLEHLQPFKNLLASPEIPTNPRHNKFKRSFKLNGAQRSHPPRRTPNLDRLAQTAAAAALRDQEYFSGCVEKIRATREWFSNELRELGYTVIPSQANFVFASSPDRDGERVYQGLFDRNILVRYFTDPLLAHGMRITIGTREEMEKTVEALRDIR